MGIPTKRENKSPKSDIKAGVSLSAPKTPNPLPTKTMKAGSPKGSNVGLKAPKTPNPLPTKREKPNKVAKGKKG